MRYLIILSLYLIFSSCKVQSPVSGVNKVVIFKSFNLLALEGIDSLKQGSGADFVKVGYKSSFFSPVFIEFHRKGADVIYLLKDSFDIGNGKMVYTYFTKNFFGGKPGKHKYYRGHYVENEFFVYINPGNDIVVYSNILVPDYYSENPIALYYLSRNGSILGCTGTFKKVFDEDVSKSEKYLKWKQYFVERGSQNCYEIDGFPGLIKTK